MQVKRFNTQKSLGRAREVEQHGSSIKAGSKVYTWHDRMERVRIVRGGILYSSVESISDSLKQPVKGVLSLVGIPQTTYNKNKKNKVLLDKQMSEHIILIKELADYGNMVFNNERDKFQRWLHKPNIALGGNTPVNMLDTHTGINIVKNCLSRIEYGNMA